MNIHAGFVTPADSFHPFLGVRLVPSTAFLKNLNMLAKIHTFTIVLDLRNQRKVQKQVCCSSFKVLRHPWCPAEGRERSAMADQVPEAQKSVAFRAR